MQGEHDPAISVPEQASLWWEVLHDEHVSAAEHREFAEWVMRSPERVAAYLRTARVRQALRSSTLQWPDTPADILIREAKAAPPEPVSMPAANIFTLPVKPRRVATLRVRSVFAMAASVLIAIGLVWLLPSRAQQFQTEFGEQRSMLLQDGTHVTLNSASRIEVDLRKDSRFVSLLEGEALFEVAHDRSRPFYVHAGNATVRVVGTRFNVYLHRERTTITVVEGLVTVRSGGETHEPSEPPLGAGDRVVVTQSGAGSVQHDVNVAAAIAWTQQQLIVEQRSLGEIAEEFARYSRRRIVIEDADLRQRKVTAVFRAYDVDSFVSFLAGIPNARVRDDGAGGYVVTSEAEQQSVH